MGCNNPSHGEVLDSVLAGNLIDLKNKHPATNNNSRDSGVALWGVLTGCERWLLDVIEVSQISHPGRARAMKG